MKFQPARLRRQFLQIHVLRKKIERQFIDSVVLENPKKFKQNVDSTWQCLHSTPLEREEKEVAIKPLIYRA